jgi:DNA-binding NarL/FixJ family response regulator
MKSYNRIGLTKKIIQKHPKQKVIILLGYAMMNTLKHLIRLAPMLLSLKKSPHLNWQML